MPIIILCSYTSKVWHCCKWLQFSTVAILGHKSILKQEAVCLCKNVVPTYLATVDGTPGDHKTPHKMSPTIAGEHSPLYWVWYTGKSRSLGSLPVRRKRFSSSLKRPIWSGTLAGSYSVGKGDHLAEVKQIVLEPGHTPPCFNEVKNDW